jgi:hypothetical protein
MRHVSNVCRERFRRAPQPWPTSVEGSRAQEGRGGRAARAGFRAMVFRAFGSSSWRQVSCVVPPPIREAPPVGACTRSRSPGEPGQVIQRDHGSRGCASSHITRGRPLG